MSRSRSRRLPRALATLVAGIAVALLLGCGGSSSSDDGPLEIRSDNVEKGDPELGRDRIRITPEGLWTPVFWVPLEDLQAGQRVGARVNIQLTNCRPSDLAAASTSSCKGTASYGFDAEIDWKLILTEEDGDSGKPKTSGLELGKPGRMNCTKQLHHCVPVAFGGTEIGKADEGDRLVAMVVRATSPRAKPCRPARPADCNVLQLTQGQGRLGVVRVVDPEAVGSPKQLESRKERAKQLRLAETSSEKKNLRESVYSIEITEPGPLVIEAELQAYFDESQPIPPLVTKELILADSPNAIAGDTVEPQNGENCVGSCTFLQPGIAPCVTEDDLSAGKRYLNLVAFSARESAFAKGSKPVDVKDGGYLRALQFDASLSDDC